MVQLFPHNISKFNPVFPPLILLKNHVNIWGMEKIPNLLSACTHYVHLYTILVELFQIVRLFTWINVSRFNPFFLPFRPLETSLVHLGKGKNLLSACTHYDVHCTLPILDCTVLTCTLYCTDLYWPAHCTVLTCTDLYTVLYCTVLICTLYCTVL